MNEKSLYQQLTDVMFDVGIPINKPLIDEVFAFIKPIVEKAYGTGWHNGHNHALTDDISSPTREDYWNSLITKGI